MREKVKEKVGRADTMKRVIACDEGRGDGTDSRVWIVKALYSRRGREGWKKERAEERKVRRKKEDETGCIGV